MALVLFTGNSLLTMRKFFEKFLWKILKWETKIILFRHKPYIIAITGSVGKTTTKEAIYHLLVRSENYIRKQVRKSPGNMNTETGLPLAVLGFTKEPKGLKWIFVLAQGLARALFSRDYPDILVLEMAADKKGDLTYLCSFVHPTISVITSIGEAHTEFFGGIREVALEKATLVNVLKDDEFAVLNYDNPYTRQLGLKTKAKVMFFGNDKHAHLYFENLVQSIESSSFKLFYQGSVIPVRLPCFGKQYVFAALAAALCGKILGIEIHNAAALFKDFQAIAGRGKIIHGSRNTILIDESYNSNPVSCELALENFAQIKNKGRKIVVLGDMLELGKDRFKLHQKIGRIAAGVGERFYLVGNFNSDFEKGILEKNDRSKIFTFSTAQLAGQALRKDLRKNDIILFKASLGIQMKKALEAVRK